MSRQSKVFVLVLAGAQQEALAFVQRRYPGRETVILPKTELRESGWKNQLRKLRELNGEALVIFTDSLQMDGTRPSMPGNRSCGLVRIVRGDPKNGIDRFAATMPHGSPGRRNCACLCLD